MNHIAFEYCVDSEDVIRTISDNWCSFARENEWSGNCKARDVIDHSIWDFIQDPETRHLYKALFKKVRSGQNIGPIPFRCDSPKERRFLELNLSLLSDNHIRIISTIIQSEERDPIDILSSAVTRSKELLKVCSMCKRIAVTEDKWEEMEEGLRQLKLFEAEKVPELTHGICPDCYHIAKAELGLD